MQLSLDEWRDLASPIFEIHPKEPEHLAGVDIEIDEIGGLFTSKVNLPHQVLVHNPKIHKSVRHDYLLFERFYSGGGKSEIGGITFETAPARFNLIDMSQRGMSEKVRSQTRGVCIPHELLGFDPSQNPTYTSLALNTPKGRLLASAHAELIAAKDHESTAEANLLARVFVDLVRQLMLGQSPTHDGDAAGNELPLSLLLRDYVTTNLHQPDLNADKLASVFNVSRPTVYRHFEEEGGVSRYIRNARLDRCFFELSTTKLQSGRVTAVARRWHFTHAANFSRLFRERFGVSPTASSNRQGSLQRRRFSDQMHIVQNWFQTDRHTATV